MLLSLSAFVSLLLSGAIFGFFYAWICSTMWGLDAIDPRVAITAMQGMNASVRNAVFAPAFFGTPVALFITAGLAVAAAARPAAVLFALGGALYVAGGLFLTMSVHVPMNESLAALPVQDSIEEAQQIWTAYTGPWQVYNTARTVVSGGTLLLCGLGIVALARHGKL